MKSTELILQEIIVLLEATQETNWSKSFRSFQQSLNDCVNDLERANVKAQLRRIFGGMGSFSDFVFYENGKPLIDENNQLEMLRRELYDSLR
ncbi:DUF6966 domain-containing protein [Limnobacter sp.]|uniref:DUF6966 domain-containing protein n=1 Tax=Limnobacter sp. TaxID=2003368 RepID=UPI002FE2DC5E